MPPAIARERCTDSQLDTGSRTSLAWLLSSEPHPQSVEHRPNRPPSIGSGLGLKSGWSLVGRSRLPRITARPWGLAPLGFFGGPLGQNEGSIVRAQNRPFVADREHCGICVCRTLSAARFCARTLPRRLDSASGRNRSSSRVRRTPLAGC